MSVFSAALDHLFEDQNLGTDALWRARNLGAGIPVRVQFSAPDREIGWRQTQIVVGSVMIEVRLSQVSELARGDTFEIGAALYVVTGDPQRDDLHLTWRAEARRQ